MSEAVSKLIAAFMAGDLDDPSSLREWVTRHRALPAMFDMGGCFAIRASGEVISFGWDTPDDVRVESDARIRNTVLLRASRRFPELASLAPARPFDAAICSYCGGDGRVKGFPPEIDNVVCYCGALGWVPATDPNGKRAG